MKPVFVFSSRRRHTRYWRDWSSDVCSSDLWGEPGTDGQHAFFQMLHQGTDIVPLEIIAVQRPSHGLQGHHEQLLANALAQAQALMQEIGRASCRERV